MTDISASGEADVIEAVRAARASRRTMEIVGAESKRAYGCPTKCDDILDVSALRSIVNYEPEELILTVLSGTPISEIAQLLAAKNQHLGFDPADWGPLFGAAANAGTIGGAIAADVAGSGAVRHGRVRDHLLGFHAVNGLGEAYKAGGRVVKNVTGFDLPKLMCGAMGTLGVLTEVTLRTFPRPPQRATLATKDIPPKKGLKLLRRVWSEPLEAIGLTYLPACAASEFPELGDVGHGVALMRVEGAPEPLREKISMIRGSLSEFHAQEIDGEEIFRRIGSGAAFASNALDVWRVFVPPAEAATIALAIDAPFWLADWAGGLLWIGAAPGDDGTRIRKIIEPCGGYATLLRASARTREHVVVFQPEDETRTALTKSVKAAFDPLGLFNPGRMYKDI